MSAYKEKAVHKNRRTTTHKLPDTTSNANRTTLWVYIGIIIGPTLAVIALALLVVQWIRTHNIRQQILTREEIKAFI